MTDMNLLPTLSAPFPGAQFALTPSPPCSKLTLRPCNLVISFWSCLELFGAIWSYLDPKLFFLPGGGCGGARSWFGVCCPRASALVALCLIHPTALGAERPLILSTTGKTGFTSLTPQTTGITFSNLLADATAAKNRILENGSGVALGDIDADGLCDIYFCRLEGPNALYRNRGDWKFEDITAKSGVACPDQYSTGAVFADVDGDDDLDLLVNSIGGGTRLFFNDGRGRFSESQNSGLDRKLGSTSLALADFEGDGDLDLYVTNYRTDTIKDSPPGVKPDARRIDGKIVVTPADRFTALMPKDGGVMLIERGEPDLFYLNDGKGQFTPVSWTGGLFVDEDGKALTEAPRDWGLSVLFRDFNGDGAPDLYVCNDFFLSPDQFWINEGGRRFRAASKLAWRNMSMSSMAADVADINRDGHDDFFVADMLSRDHRARHRQRANAQHLRQLNQPMSNPEFRPEFLRNTLYLNRGDNTYGEIAQLSGVDATEWTWSAAFLDVDLDGYEDLLITNGNLHDVLDADTLAAIAAPSTEDPKIRHLKNLLKFPRIETANLCYRNRGDLTFEEMGAAWGFNTRGISHGMALGDLDNDGDLDVVVNNLNGPAGIYRNDSIAPRINVRLKGHAVGARIKVLGGPVPQSQSIICGSRYLSGDDLSRTFAPGTSIEVTWRSGAITVVSNVESNRAYEIQYGVPPLGGPAAQPPKGGIPYFNDLSHLLNHTHVEDSFDDFVRQPLLPRRLSRLGPGVAWFDIDGDGWDDLIVGAGKGGRMAIFRNDIKGEFTPWTNAPLSKPVSRDQTGIVGISGMMLVGSANYEDGLTNGGSVRVYDMARGVSGESVLGPLASTGPLASADIDGDGDLDLFVGGRVVAGRYPESALSQWLRNESGRFVPVQKWEHLDLVSSAVLSDLDADGDPDLVLACEWGSLRAFRNQAGTFTDITESLGLAKFTGWWNGVTTGDFDADGRLDIVASNWGRNTKYQAHLAAPLRAFGVVEAYFEPTLKKVVPWAALDVLSTVMPQVRQRISSHRAYGTLGVEEILGVETRQLQVTTLDSMLFLNRGDHFEPRPLPVEAQFAPAFGLAVGDANGDGHEDLFLAQNFFDVEPETSRYDAGRGLWLQGDARGAFKPLPESGIKIYGQQRGTALCDFDADGRLDLVVAQNGGATKLFRNLGARPGLRVRLKGPPGNPTGIGACLRLENDSLQGPLRELHAGAGYWSQDSAVQVLSLATPPQRLWVRWPGGQTSTVTVSNGMRELTVTKQQ